MADDYPTITLSDEVDRYNEERTIAGQDLFVALWSPRAARDPSRVKRQTLHARRHNVPVLVVAMDGAPALPPWLVGAPTIPFAGASQVIRDGGPDLGAILGRWEGP